MDPDWNPVNDLQVYIYLHIYIHIRSQLLVVIMNNLVGST